MEDSKSMVNMLALSNEILIKQFVKQVRNIIWWNIFGHYIDRSFQFFAGIMLFLGMINLFLFPLSIEYCLIVALCCLFFGLIFSVKKRPTIIETAHHIDKQFNGQSLMITAIELLSSTGKEEQQFRQWLLHQAGLACIKWKFQTKNFNRYRPNNLTALAGGTVLMGFFFMLQPGSRLLVNTTALSSAVQKKAVSKTTDSSSLFTSLREESRVSVKAEVSNSGKNNNSFTVANKQGTTKKKNILETNKSKDKLNEVNQLNANTQNIPVGSRQDYRHNIDGIGSQADNAPFSTKDNEITNLRLKPVKMELPSNDVTHSNKPGLPFSKQDYVGNQEFTHSVLNARKQNITMSFRSGFSSSQQQYISAYFNKRHEQK